MLRTICISLAACFAGSASAQHPVPPDSADPKASVPLRPYVSAFEGYRPYVDPEIARWREVNDEVGRLKGHVGHVSQQPDTVAKPAAKPPAQGGHEGHK